MSPAFANPDPPGHIAYACGPDGWRYRYGYWPARGAGAAGVCVLLPGRSEFLEKYLETVADLQQRGFAVWSLDWLGQGLADRLAPQGDRRGYIDSFASYERQLAHFLDAVVGPADGPLIALAHSMGGNILLQHLSRRRPPRERRAFDRVVLLAPMLSIKLPGLVGPAARVLARWAVRVGRGGEYALSQGPRSVTTRFAGNPLTGDPRRFARILTWLDTYPELATTGVTWAWLQAAFTSCRQLGRRAARRIPEPVLVLTAGQDTVVGTGAQRRFCAQLPLGRRVVLESARHEILQETDTIRAQAWSAIDGFLAQAASAATAWAPAAVRRGLAGSRVAG